MKFKTIIALITLIGAPALSAFAEPAPSDDIKVEECSDKMAALKDGIQLFRDGKYKQAEVKLSTLLNSNPPKSIWGITSIFLGQALQAQSKYQQAIYVFERILYSDVNDRDPSLIPGEGFSNYKHNACILLANLYESRKQDGLAYKHIYMAINIHKFQSDSPASAEISARTLAHREEVLNAKSS